MSTVASIYFYQHHTPSGQSRLYRVTQLRTDGVHCRESVGTGPVVLNLDRVTGAAFASPWTKCYCAPLFSHTHYWYKVSMFKLSGVYQNISTAVLFCGTVFSPRRMACTGVKSQVYTVQYHPLCVKTLSLVCNTAVLWTRFLPLDLLCLYKCKEFSVHGTI